MFGIGIPELILILIVGLIVFGPSKLPEVGRAVGKGLREFRKASSALQATLNAPDEPPPQKVAAPSAPSPSSDAPAASSPPPQAPTATAVGGTANAAKAPADSTGSVAANGVAEANEAVDSAPAYVPPTQESVRAELLAKKSKETEEVKTVAVSGKEE